MAGSIATAVLIMWMVLGLPACGSYRATVQPVQDEIIVKVVPEPAADYAHPIQLTPAELTAILENVRVEYKSNWLQSLLTGQPKAQPLFDPQSLARIVIPLVRAFNQVGPHERIVFYLAQRRSEVRREVTSGTVYVTDRLMHLALTNYQNSVDVVPGVPTYDQRNPEIAVAPQRFTVSFERPEFVIPYHPTLMQGMFGGEPPSLVVDYQSFLSTVMHHAALRPSP